MGAYFIVGVVDDVTAVIVVITFLAKYLCRVVAQLVPNGRVQLSNKQVSKSCMQKKRTKNPCDLDL